MTKKKRKVINMNHPPEDMSQKDVADLMGEPTIKEVKELEENAKKARDRLDGTRTRESYGY